MRRLIPALAATLLALPAWADPLPSLVPTHDVTGTYLFTDSQGTHTIAVEYSVDANAMRMTPQAGDTDSLYPGDAYILYDFNANDAKIVMPQLQQFFEQPQLVGVMQRVEGDLDNGNASVTPGAQETIAGYACTDYTAGGSGASICVTADGVLLKLIATDGDSIVAQSVSYDGVSVSEVQVPSGYTQIPTPPVAGSAPQ